LIALAAAAAVTERIELVTDILIAWISKHGRTTRDYERLPASHEAMILWAMIALITPAPGPAR